MDKVRRTVLMIHPGGLGDILLAVPAMVRLRTRFPDHSMVLCAEDHIAKLLRACRIIDAAISLQGRACTDLFAGVGSVTDHVRTCTEGCDLAVGWTQDPDGKLHETLKAAGVREITVRSPFSTTIRSRHQCDRFLEVINEVPVEEGGSALLAVTEPLHDLAQAFLEETGLANGWPFAVIHPGSGSTHKCVAPKPLAAVVNAVQASGTAPVILEGPADRDAVERLLPLCVTPPIVLKGVDVCTVCGVLARACLFVGQDSGITHLAGLMGVCTLAIFGPTDPTRWAPRGAHVTVVQGASCLCRSWEEVSQCEEKPCLKVSQDHLVTLCLTRLKGAAVRQRIESDCLVTDHHVC